MFCKKRKSSQSGIDENGNYDHKELLAQYLLSTLSYSPRLRSTTAAMSHSLVSELMEERHLDWTAPTVEPTPAIFNERQVLETQLHSLGFDFNNDHEFQQWTDGELKELIDVMTTSANEARDEDQQPEMMQETPFTVTIEKHVPNVNDKMSGALPPHSESDSECSAPEEFDDPTVSKDTLPRLYRSMPHYMISVKVLKTLNLFNNQSIYDSMPNGFFTTVNGLKRAWDVANAAQPDATKDMDDHLLEAILERGGIVENAYWSVKYPCDIIPLDGGQGDPEFWKEIRQMDWSSDERRERDERTNNRFAL